MTSPSKLPESGFLRLMAMAMILGIIWIEGTPAAMAQGAKSSRLATNLKAGQTQTVITYGTSLTSGGAWVSQLKEAFDQAYPGQVSLINSGAGGMWSTWGIQNLDQRVIEKKPDLVTIEFGINDAYLEYKTSVEKARENLENMIDRILKSNPRCEIVLMVMNPPIKVHLERRPRIKDYYQMYREVAKQRQLPLIDHYPAWERILREDPGLFDRYVPDGIHPGPQGCEAVITPAIIRALGIRAIAPAQP
jgi:lysophospholipase L1-like esterase